MTADKNRIFTFYHGTVTGRDGFYLDSFIVTGALGSKSRNTKNQQRGVYFNAGAPQWAYAFASATGQETELHTGRGMIVQVKTALDGANWMIDHEMGEYYSLKLLKTMRDALPALAQGQRLENPDAPRPFQVSLDAVSVKGGRLGIDYTCLLTGEKHRQDYGRNEAMPNRAHPGASVFLLDALHNLLKTAAAGRYAAENLKILTEMAEQGSGSSCLKYTGQKPLPVDKIYLFPENVPEHSIDIPPLEQWEQVYSRRKTAGATPQQVPKHRSGNRKAQP